MSTAADNKKQTTVDDAPAKRRPHHARCIQSGGEEKAIWRHERTLAAVNAPRSWRTYPVFPATAVITVLSRQHPPRIERYASCAAAPVAYGKHRPPVGLPF
ncbi:hypothetical protein roselon_02662 [Roseibacterium elongatum DSM 19469]|uniref:Uncharacterized protein n=1 Tax=Roseicyclus elongatus DSM 19469 TaxID=1294273 RepID=W8S7S8_9RHOB|nr:hypothetical protein roselon_02662 [Roseibacterium elongatum DSM 19469]